MRNFVFWLRSVFCDHYWIYDEKIMQRFRNSDFHNEINVSATCEFCGWHRSYWKHVPISMY